MGSIPGKRPQRSRRQRRPRDKELAAKRIAGKRQPQGPAVSLPALNEDGTLSEPLNGEQISWIRRAVACHYMSHDEARAFGVEPDRREYVRPAYEDVYVGDGEEEQAALFDEPDPED